MGPGKPLISTHKGSFFFEPEIQRLLLASIIGIIRPKRLLAAPGSQPPTCLAAATLWGPCVRAAHKDEDRRQSLPSGRTLSSETMGSIVEEPTIPR
jgi:hypothetical protein